MAVDNFPISKNTREKSLCNKFLKFIYQAKNIKYHFGQHPFVIATNDFLELVRRTDVVEDIWVEIKSK